MATPPLFNGSINKVRTYTSFSDKTYGRSKTQMCLKKIIDIISSGSSIQPREIFKRISTNPIPEESKYEEKTGLGEKARDLFEEKRGFGVDLNLRLGPRLESENLTVNQGFSACSGVGDGDGDGDGKVCGIAIDCNSSVVCGEYLTVDKSSEGECDPREVEEDFPETEVNREEEEQDVIEEERREFSEITNLPETETERVRDETEDGEHSEIKAATAEEEEDEEGEEEGEDEEEEIVEVDDEREKQRDEEGKSVEMRNCRNEGYLDLLVEAARLISGNFEDDERDEEEKRRLSNESTEKTTLKINEAETGHKKTIGCRSKRNQSWMLDFYEGFEDISPVVRSKRGRNQVLPYRYRDSVLDPWKRFSKQRSSRVSTKNKT